MPTTMVGYGHERTSLLGQDRGGEINRNPVRPLSQQFQWVEGILLGFQVFMLTTLLLTIIFLLGDSIALIKPGEVGVVVTLGKVTVMGPGAYLRSPIISRVTRMSTKTQLLEQQNTIPTKEGLSVKLDTAILYRLEFDKSEELFTNVGVNYQEVLIEPEAASAIRGLTSEQDANALYTSGRNVIQEALKAELIKSLGPRGITIEDVLLKEVELPSELSKSIELKAKAEQDALRMQFVLEKERQEADRKAIEAEGISQFQKIVSQGISTNLLKWKAIEATERMAESTNAKIIIMGNSDSGLPVLLSAAGGDEATAGVS